MKPKTRRQGHRRTERASPTAPRPSSRRHDRRGNLDPREPRPPAWGAAALCGPRASCVDDRPVPQDDRSSSLRRTGATASQRRRRGAGERTERATETTRANLAVCLRGQWCTPPLDCGLLPGIERARLVASGRLIEKVITVEDLHRAEGAATLSSLRGWRPPTSAPIAPADARAASTCSLCTVPASRNDVDRW